MSDEEVEILSTELDRVRAELAKRDERRPGPLSRLWRRVVGELVYSGPETCGHCRFWRPPRNPKKEVKCTSNFHEKHGGSYWNCKAGAHIVGCDLGDCKLLFGKKDTTKDDTCHRFKARRRYKHRERS